jgi:ketosteroid isomerase-like protein
MSGDNLESAREILNALGERDAERLIALSDPDVEWHSFFALAEAGAYRGHDGARRYMRDLTDAFEIGSAEVDGGIEAGDVTVFVGRIHYRGKGSGVDAKAAAGWMLKFRDGKLVRFRAFRDPESALESVGLGSR